METAGLYVTYDVDLGGFNQKVKQAESNFKKSADAIRKAGASMTALGRDLTLGLTAPLVLAGSKALLMASDMQESLNKVDVAFKNSSKEVRTFAKTSLSQFGITQAAALDTAALFGDMATGMGLTTTEAASMATKLTGLSGDLASFKNIQQDVAKTALAGIFTGETESLKQLGIVMTQTNLEAFALATGINKTMKEMTEAEKINLRYAFILDKTKNSQGDFARTSDGFANRLRVLQGTFQSLVTEIATGFLPIASKGIKAFTDMLNAARSATVEQKAFALEMAAVAAAAGPALFMIGKFADMSGRVIGAVDSMKKAFTGLDKTMLRLSAKITLIVGALGGIVLLGKSIYDTYEPIRTFLVTMWDAIANKVKAAVTFMTNALKPFFKFLGIEFDDALEGITKAWDEFTNDFTDLAEPLKLDELWENMKKNFNSLVQFVGEGASSMFQPILDQFAKVDGAFKDMVSGGGGGGGAAATGGGGVGDFGGFTRADMPAMPDKLEKIDTSGIDAYAKAYEDAQARIDAATQEIGASIGNNLGEMITGGKSLLAGLKDIFGTIIKSLINAAITAIAAGEAINKSFTGFGAIALAAGAAAAAGAFFNSMPAFAAGGYHSGGMALVGERGPEIINTGAARVFNAGQTEKMLSGSMEPVQGQGQNSGGGSIEMGTPTVKIKGNDIVMAFEKAKLVQRKGIGFNTVYNS